MDPSSTVDGPAGQRHSPGLLLRDGNRDRLRLGVGAGLLVGRPGTGHRLTRHPPQVDDLGPGPDGRALPLRILRNVLDEVVDPRSISHGAPPISTRVISVIPGTSPEFLCPSIHHTPGESSRLHCYKDMVIAGPVTATPPAGA